MSYTYIVFVFKHINRQWTFKDVVFILCEPNNPFTMNYEPLLIAVRVQPLSVRVVSFPV